MHQKHPPAKAAFSRPGADGPPARARGIGAPNTIVANITSARKIPLRATIRPPARCAIIQYNATEAVAVPRRAQSRFLRELALDRIRQLEVLLGDTALIVRRQREGDAPVVHRDVRMMVHLL